MMGRKSPLCLPAVLTQDVLGAVLVRNVTRVTVADLIDGVHAELILGVFHQAGHLEAGLLQLLW